MIGRGPLMADGNMSTLTSHIHGRGYHVHVARGVSADAKQRLRALWRDERKKMKK